MPKDSKTAPSCPKCSSTTAQSSGTVLCGHHASEQPHPAAPNATPAGDKVLMHTGSWMENSSNLNESFHL
ncbi:hypothetical protein BJ508DRAFT_322102 [Ascobolus immersus RN42]|uniref:Uncharacterized protein n=1 Tax=Ascobolus immersus RN42 TaxID=1160509 RepID=A0A3N4IP51_ASCIM|nr:hypothetical protein BJ508DRAFT_322102 [Ascobolus immersus RN42]